MPRPEWSPLPRPGCVGVEGRVLLAADGLVAATLRLSPHATIDEHDAPFPVDVVCLSGSGFTSVDGESAPIRSGQTVRWPAHQLHRLWTEDDGMTTLMLERR